MSISNGFTPDEVRDLVLDYERQPHGSKKDWLKAHAFTDYRIRRWRAAVFDGDLDRGLIPREGALVDVPAGDRRTLAKLRQREQAAHDAEVAALQAQIRQLQQSNEALGKAIGLLHEMNEQEPDAPHLTTDAATAEPKTAAQPSSPPNTTSSKN